MSTPLTLHVPPDAGPESTDAIFEVLTSAGSDPLTPAVLRDRAAEMTGRRPRGEALALLRDLELVAQSPGAVTLTPRGQALGKEGDAADLIHGLSYLAWAEDEPARLSRMWTYRTVVDLLWERAPATITALEKKQLVEDLLARAESVFATVKGFVTARASLGPKSIDGVLRWLEQIDPPVLRQRQIVRRQRCAPRLMVLALTAVVERAGGQVGSDFRLGAEDRALLCRCCFLDPASLDAMLDWTMQTQPRHVRWGTRNARYGRQIMITGGPPV